jgi:hypothetical protein
MKRTTKASLGAFRLTASHVSRLLYSKGRGKQYLLRASNMHMKRRNKRFGRIMALQLAILTLRRAEQNAHALHGPGAGGRDQPGRSRGPEDFGSFFEQFLSLSISIKNNFNS